MKMDVIPGRETTTASGHPDREGTFAGKCTELCGVYHSRMLFNVEVVSAGEYDAYLEDLEAQGNVADEPLLGGEDARTQAGLEDAQTRRRPE